MRAARDALTLFPPPPAELTGIDARENQLTYLPSLLVLCVCALAPRVEVRQMSKGRELCNDYTVKPLRPLYRHSPFPLDFFTMVGMRTTT